MAYDQSVNLPPQTLLKHTFFGRQLPEVHGLLMGHIGLVAQDLMVMDRGGLNDVFRHFVGASGGCRVLRSWVRA
jgi:hypothetical protein